jgi:hypothetical protein
VTEFVPAEDRSVSVTASQRTTQLADLRDLAAKLGITLTRVEPAMEPGEFEMDHDPDCLVVQYGGQRDLMHMRDVSYLSVTREFGCDWDWTGPVGFFWFLSRAPYRRAIPYADLPDLIACLRMALQRREVDPQWRREFC